MISVFTISVAAKRILFIRPTGCEELYEVKKRLYQALLDKDLERAQMITDQSIEAAMNQQSEFVPK